MGALCSSCCIASGIANAAPAAASPLSRFNLAAISDGFSQDFEEALKIMQSYGLGWVEIRRVFGLYNTETSPAQIQKKKELRKE